MEQSESQYAVRNHSYSYLPTLPTRYEEWRGKWEEGGNGEENGQFANSGKQRLSCVSLTLGGHQLTDGQLRYSPQYLRMTCNDAQRPGIA